MSSRLFAIVLVFAFAVNFPAAKTAPSIPAGLMDEAARLQSQWGSQMAELAQSGQPLNMIQPKMVNLSRLNPPVTRPFAEPLKLNSRKGRSHNI